MFFQLTAFRQTKPMSQRQGLLSNQSGNYEIVDFFE